MKAIIKDIYEPHLTPVLEYVIRAKRGAIFDIGANVGQILRKFLNLNSARLYVAIEPNVDAARIVGSLAEQRGAENVRVLPVALSNRQGSAVLSIASRFDVGATIVPEYYHDDGKSERRIVPVTTGDHVVREQLIEDVCLIKIDAEGAEPEILLGFTQTIELFQPFIVCELIPVQSVDLKLSRERARRRREVFSILKQKDYTGFSIDDSAHLSIVDTVEREIECTAWEYLFIPKSVDVPRAF